MKKSLSLYFIISLIMVAAILLISGTPEAYAGYFTDGLVFLLNWLPVLAVGLIFLGLTGRFGWAFFLWVLFFAIFTAAATIKINLRQEGLKPLDLTLIPTVVQIIPAYIKEVPVWAYAFALLFLLVLIWLATRWKQPFSGFKRLLPLASGVLILLLLFSGPYKDSELYVKIPHTNTYHFHLEEKIYQAHGAPYAFCYYMKFSYDAFAQCDKKLVEEVLGRYERQPFELSPKPDILVYQLESFIDYRQNSDTFVKNPYEKWYALEKESIAKGELLAVTYGGGTVVTETGVMIMAKNPPHLNQPRQTFATYLKENGYYAESFHPNDGTFYNRVNLHPAMGFDQFYHSHNFFHNDLNVFMKDKDLMKDVYAKYTAGEKPYFSFTIAIENHGPYNTSTFTETPWLKENPEIAEKDMNMANHFLSGMADSAQEVYHFTRQLNALKRPVICAFYGDHSPNMTEGAYKALGYPIPREELSPEEALHLSYATPILFWANDAAKTLYDLPTDGPLDLGEMDARYMMPAFAEVFHLGGYPRMAYLNDLRHVLPVVRDDLYKEGDHYTEKLSPQGEKALNEAKQVEIFYKKHRYEVPQDLATTVH